jgi:hypothetical protein
MGLTALFIVCLLYLVTALDYYRKQDVGMCVAFIAYAAANIGFMINLWSKMDGKN